jgi:hypothetical protein
MIRLAIAAMLGGWLVAISTGHARAAFLCVPIDVPLREFEAVADIEIWSPQSAKLAFAWKPALAEGWELPFSGVLVIENAKPGEHLIGMIVGNSICGGKLWESDVLTGLRHAVLGFDA